MLLLTDVDDPPATRRPSVDVIDTVPLLTVSVPDEPFALAMTSVLLGPAASKPPFTVTFPLAMIAPVLVSVPPAETDSGETIEILFVELTVPPAMSSNPPPAKLNAGLVTV